jgi:peptidyl-prolyl cis-trans isomerase C
VKTRVAIVLIAVALVAACKKAPADATKTAAATTATAAAGAAAGQPQGPAAAKPVPAQLPEILARVNGTPIERGEFERAVKSLEAQAGGPVPPEQRDAIYRQMLDQLVALKLLSQECAARKVNVPDADVDGRLAQVKGQFPNEQAFTAALAERQMTPDKLKADLRQQMQAMKLVETDVAPTVTVTEADINDFYTKNPDRFHEPEAVHVTHILLRTPENADDAAKKKAKSDAQSVLAQLKKGGDFAALAKQYSQDPGSAPNGGDLGFVTKGQTVPAFEQAAFAMKPGQLSGVVESPFGFHVIKMVAHRDARTVPLTEVRPQVEQFLKNQKTQEKTAAYVEKLKAKGKVQILI